MNRARGDQSDVANTVNGDIFGGIVIQGRDLHVVHLAPHKVDWPVRVGVIPEQAAHFQYRAVTDRLCKTLNNFGTVVLRQVLSGAGGVGKTQLAAHYARTLRDITDPEQRVDVLVWADASARDRITFAYAQAAHRLFAIVPDDPEDAAKAFLTWLGDPANNQKRRWLVIWDDLADPAQLRDLWPPHDHPHGRVLVTTRRRDHSLTTQGRHLFDVDVFTPEEARTFLTRALNHAGIAHTITEMDELAETLGRLPLALGQAVAYMAELSLGCTAYLQRFHDRTTTLGDVFPDWDTPIPLATTWDLSLRQASTHTPAGVAQPLMSLISLLAPEGIPISVLTAQCALSYLTAHRTNQTKPGSDAGRNQIKNDTTVEPIRDIEIHDARKALANLQRLGLVNIRGRLDEKNTLLSMHQIVQRATREHHSTRPSPYTARAAAHALVDTWPSMDQNAASTQRLRANAKALREHANQWLWEKGEYNILFRLGVSLGESGNFFEARKYWCELLESASSHLRADHPDIFVTRSNIARWRGKSGYAAEAVKSYTELLTDMTHALGSKHPDTLLARSNLAHWQGEAGDVPGAAKAYAELLTDMIRVLGPDHPHTLTAHSNLAHMRGLLGDAVGTASAYARLLSSRISALGPDHPHTLTTRHNLARWRGESGDPKGAAHTLDQLLTDMIRVLGPDHPHTLTTRHNLARWRGESGDPKGAAHTLDQLLTDMIRVLGPDHPHTLTTRHNLARWRGESGDPKGAAHTLDQLLTDMIRVLGPDHPHTLTTRHNLAWWIHESVNRAKAIVVLQALIPDQERVLGRNHSETRDSKQVLERWIDEFF
ncbi:tetratricopeptide repeat protein [Nocardiopsis ganjiahuensis]|uniref:tetratricopeptide repeat protein n=1 Tax=Nocardiopsis ganjiahuensis TaxID=239984 RepID=UPI000345873F|nr:tetratricopeptide repeat protein [Nocardiopsis ganjiahuensis]